MDDAVELVTLRTTATLEREPWTVAYAGEGDARTGDRTAIFDDERHDTPVYARYALAAGREIGGPAILEADESTTVLPPSWSAAVADDGTLVCSRRGES